MAWPHMPIPDGSTPGAAFDARRPEVSARLRARLLVETGVDPDVAMKRVRTVRSGAIETDEQEEWLRTGPATVSGR